MAIVLTISKGSGISADGFHAEVKSNDTVVFQKDYAYGYDASWNRDFASDEKPFKDDIISELCDEYGIDPDTVVYEEGRNMFKEEMPAKEKIQNVLAAVDLGFADAVDGISIPDDSLEQ